MQDVISENFYKQLSRAIVQLCLHMGKQAREKPIPWQENKNSSPDRFTKAMSGRGSFHELFKIFGWRLEHIKIGILSKHHTLRYTINRSKIFSIQPPEFCTADGIQQMVFLCRIWLLLIVVMLMTWFLCLMKAWKIGEVALMKWTRIRVVVTRLWHCILSAKPKFLAAKRLRNMGKSLLLIWLAVKG